MRPGPDPRMGSAVPRMGRLVAVIDRVIEGHPLRRGMNGGRELPAWMQHFRRMCYVVGHTVTLAGPVRKENRGCHAYGNCAPPEMPCFNQAPFHNACTDFCAWRPVAHRRSYFHGTALGLDLHLPTWGILSIAALALLIVAIVVVFHLEPGAVTVLAICAFTGFGLRMAGVV